MNVDRLIQTLNHIIQHPETWDQKQWHCETSHCFAGHGQINSGKDINIDTCFEDAREWYGLNYDDAEWLFDGLRPLSEIHAFVKAAKDGQSFFDEDGYNLYGYDRFGYDENGYDKNGYDEYGYDKNRYDEYAFNRDGYKLYYGYDCDGYDRYGYDRYGYDHEGYDREGFDYNGVDRSGNKLPLL